MGTATGSWQVRAATSADFAAVTSIYGHHVLHGTATFEFIPPTMHEIAARFADVMEMGLPFLVATDGERVHGFACAVPYRTRPAYAYTVEDSVYLSPRSLGRGIGTQLLTALLPPCEAWGAR